MGLGILATLGRFFRSLLLGVGGTWKILFTRIGLAGLIGWRWLILITILIIFVGNSIGMSIKEQDETIFLKDAGSFLFSTDKNIEMETEKVLENQDDMTYWGWIFSFMKIMSNIYMMYFWYWLGFKVVNFFNDQSASVFSKLFWSSILILTLRSLYVVIMINSGTMTLENDFDGNMFRVVFPYYGLWIFAKNITLWTQPVVDLFS